MKQNLKLTILVFFFQLALTADSSPNLTNIYKLNKNVKHSLFREKDSQDRMSVYRQGIPEKLSKTKIPKDDDPEKVVAAKLADYYRKIFDYLDYRPVDDLINAEELSEAFRDFCKFSLIFILINLILTNLDWPKATIGVTDDLKYSKTLIKKYDKGGKNSLNFVEFCHMMEDLWDASDIIAELKCNRAIDRAKDIFEKLFRWLDRDQDGFVSPHDLIYGISRIMIRDVDLNEIKSIFITHDPKKTGKINRISWILAMGSGMLKNSLSNNLNTKTLFSK
jgi:Ca2+-binding EF-hand superfamily protein